MELTSANANKLIKKLTEKKTFLITKEISNRTYVAAENEEPVRPKYDYRDTQRNIRDIDEKIATLKHTINVVNTTNEITIGDKSFTIDVALVRLAQLNARKSTLDSMRSCEPKSRLNSGYRGNNTVVEYSYTNYCVDDVTADYESIDNEITAIQLALDSFNQTFKFDVNIEL